MTDKRVLNLIKEEAIITSISTGRVGQFTRINLLK